MTPRFQISISLKLEEAPRVKKCKINNGWTKEAIFIEGLKICENTKAPKKK